MADERLTESMAGDGHFARAGFKALLAYSVRAFLNSRSGRERSWIAQALPAKDYPADNHALVMELMEKFEVPFALEQPEVVAGQPKEPQRWLIPELLPEAQPAAFAEFR
jgi:hypothetical protein